MLVTDFGELKVKMFLYIWDESRGPSPFKRGSFCIIRARGWHTVANGPNPAFCLLLRIILQMMWVTATIPHICIANDYFML